MEGSIDQRLKEAEARVESEWKAKLTYAEDRIKCSKENLVKTVDKLKDMEQRVEEQTRSGNCLSEAYIGANRLYQTKEIELAGVQANLTEMEDSVKKLGDFINRNLAKTQNESKDKIDLRGSAPDIMQYCQSELTNVFSSLQYLQGQNIANQDRIQSLKAEADKVKAGNNKLQLEIHLLRGQMAKKGQPPGPTNRLCNIINENTQLRLDLKMINDQKTEFERLFNKTKDYNALLERMVYNAPPPLVSSLPPKTHHHPNSSRRNAVGGPTLVPTVAVPSSSIAAAAAATAAQQVSIPRLSQEAMPDSTAPPSENGDKQSVAGGAGTASADKNNSDDDSEIVEIVEVCSVASGPTSDKHNNRITSF